MTAAATKAGEFWRQGPEYRGVIGEFYNRPFSPIGTPVSFIVDNWYLIIAAVVSGGLLLWPTFKGGGAQSVSTAEAVRQINREKAVLIDVCEPAEFAESHASGSRNIPLASLVAGVKGLPSNKSLPVLLMCRSGARAAKAAVQLRQLGFANANAVAGGQQAWRDANLPIERSASA
jgi:rhodanese-related sulfurtransferase